MNSTIRRATSLDAPAIAEIYAPFCTSELTTFEETPPSAADMAARIAKGGDKHPWLVFEEEGRVGGYAYGSVHRERAGYRWTVEVSVYLAPECRGRGVGRALYTTLFAILTAQGYRRLIAGVALPNDASVRLHESVGFTRVGVYRAIGWKLGQWVDVAWFEQGIGDPTGPDDNPIDSPPPEPKRLSEIENSPAWEAAFAAGLKELRS